MPAARRSKQPAVLSEKFDTFQLGPRRVLRAGVEAKIRLVGRSAPIRARFRYADVHGGLTFTDPRNGAQRTVTADAVVSICRTARGRGPS